MGLNYEMALYTELTGEDGTKVPIGQLGHFLWGYEIGVEKGRPKGKWIDSGKVRKIGGYCADCSVCGEWSEYLTNFCGNCGADMRCEE